MKKPKKVTIAQKAKKAGIPAHTVYNRMHHGWHEKKALSVPVRKRAKPKKVEPKVETVGSRVKPATTLPNKAPSPLSQRMKKIPLPIQKFEGKKTYMDSPRTVVVSLAVILVIVILVVVNT